MTADHISPDVAAPGRSAVLDVDDLRFTYPVRRRSDQPRSALRGVTFTIAPGEFFCVLGPNGSGKSTLFRILTTALRAQSGRVTMFGKLVAEHLLTVRSQIGVVFQHPALDIKLTVSENLRTHGKLYGMAENDIRRRSGDMLRRLGLQERSADYVEVLSGGLQRRVELAKSLLHSPRILFLDEPTTGLDPAARIDFIELLREFQREAGATIVYTTHLLDEAEEADNVLILDDGEIVTRGSPAALRAGIGGELILLKSPDPSALLSSLREKYSLPLYLVDDSVRVECVDASVLIPELLREYGDKVEMVTFSRPSIEDVYIRKTGHRFRSGKP